MPVKRSVSLPAVPVAWWRFMILTAIAVGLYFVARAIIGPPQTHPALLLATLPAGWLCGFWVAKWKTSTARRPQPRRGLLSPTAARGFVLGLAGLGVILAQALPESGPEWLALGLTALFPAGAGHAWLLQREQEA